MSMLAVLNSSCVIRYYETVYERSRKNMFGLLKILARYLVN